GLAEVVRPINELVASSARPDMTLKEFVEKVYLPFYRRKWKRVTIESRTVSITNHIVVEFGSRPLSSLTRSELQKFLDDRKGLSFTMVDHLRWDLKQVLDL